MKRIKHVPYTIKPPDNGIMKISFVLGRQKVFLFVSTGKQTRVIFRILEKRTVVIDVDITMELTLYWVDDVLKFCRTLISVIDYPALQKNRDRLTSKPV